MYSSEGQEKEIWENWLPPEYGEKLEEIREAVRELHRQNDKRLGPMTYFTPHGVEHCESVENLIHKLIPGLKHEELKHKEKYYLLASAWLHDIGMIKSVAEVIDKKHSLDVHFIRKHHHIISDQYIVEYPTKLKVHEEDKEILGKLCRYHRRIEDINKCEELFLVGNERFRLKLLVSYLRLADALDIGPSRVPMESYAICLAYNIPEESKLHWIKSRLINGIYPHAEDRKIYLQFKFPKPDNIGGRFDLNSPAYKLNSIMNFVLTDLQDELKEIINVLTREGISYYLDITPTYSDVTLDNRMKNDLKELVLNYDIMMAPSASRILEIILQTVANILGFSLYSDVDPEEIVRTTNKPYNELQSKLDEFYETIEKMILENRPCHLGLEQLVKDLINPTSAVCKKNKKKQAIIRKESHVSN